MHICSIRTDLRRAWLVAELTAYGVEVADGCSSTLNTYGAYTYRQIDSQSENLSPTLNKPRPPPPFQSPRHIAGRRRIGQGKSCIAWFCTAAILFFEIPTRVHGIRVKRCQLVALSYLDERAQRTGVRSSFASVKRPRDTWCAYRRWWRFSGNGENAM